MVSVLQKLISSYQWLISPWLGARCRYSPSCSEYASQSLQVHGLFKGSVLAGKRLCRCHPWGGQGYDPVPRPDKETTVEAGLSPTATPLDSLEKSLHRADATQPIYQFRSNGKSAKTTHPQ